MALQHLWPPGISRFVLPPHSPRDRTLDSCPWGLRSCSTAPAGSCCGAGHEKDTAGTLVGPMGAPVDDPGAVPAPAKVSSARVGSPAEKSKDRGRSSWDGEGALGVASSVELSEAEEGSPQNGRARACGGNGRVGT